MRSILMASVILIPLAGCHKKGAEALPLVLSVPYSQDGRLFRTGLTDSFLYYIKLFEPEPENYLLELRRVPFSEPADSETFTYFVKEPFFDSFSFILEKLEPLTYELEETKMPFPQGGWTVFPVPLGDTAGMQTFGHVRMQDRPLKVFGQGLREYHQLFYVVDVNAPEPRTIAKFEGYVLDTVYPYLLMHTGYGYKRKAMEYSHENIDMAGSEFVVVDLGRMTEVLEIPFLPVLHYGSGNRPVRLTAGGYLMIKGRMGFDQDERLVYLIEQKRYMKENDLFNVSESTTGRMIRLLDVFKVPRFSFLEDQFLKLNVPFRNFSLASCGFFIYDLNNGTVALKEAIAPYDILDDETETFLDEGRLFFLCPPGGWGYPGFFLNRDFIYTPSITDLEGPPIEFAEFRKIKKGLHDRRWYLSPEKKWLVLTLSDRNANREEVLFIPIEDLIHRSVLEKKGTFLRILSREWPLELNFVPGEKWVLASRNDPEGEPVLYDCSGEKPPVPLLAVNEREASHVIFSPDGCYVGYLCEIEGKQGSFLQVRRLPD
ncbi:hypothetical protein JXM67_02620 [candidate division WOR-3 bacterium]|nr:hypothetical protein [candidate division WOR-3 bacterium]